MGILPYGASPSKYFLPDTGEKISKKFSEKDNPTIDFVEKLESQLNWEKDKCLEEEHQLFLNLETKLKTSKKDIEIASKRKSIIIDTNLKPTQKPYTFAIRTSHRLPKIAKEYVLPTHGETVERESTYPQSSRWLTTKW